MSREWKTSNNNFQWCFADFPQTLNVNFQEEFRYLLKDGYYMGLREWIEQRWEKWQQFAELQNGVKRFVKKYSNFYAPAVSRKIIIIFILFPTEFLIKISWKRRNMKIRMFLHHSVVSAEEYSKVPPSGHAATAAATIAYRVAEKLLFKGGLSFSGLAGASLQYQGRRREI